jgi:glycosyltransferase involved in cell wall biosynthesis
VGQKAYRFVGGNLRKILMVTQFYYPDRIIGAHRLGRLTKYLPDEKWHSVVLTVKEKYASILDKELYSEIPNTTEVIRSNFWSCDQLRPFISKIYGQKLNLEAIRSSSVSNTKHRSGFKAWIEVPDAIGWLPFGLIKGLCVSDRCDMIWATSPTTTSLVISALLGWLVHKPLVVDFRDPWRVEQARPYPTRFHKMIDRGWEKFVLNQAARIVVVTEGIAHEYRQRFPQHAHKIFVIYNGFDDCDFNHLEPVIDQSTLFDGLKLGYLGSLYQGREQSFLKLMQAVGSDRQQSESEPVRVFARGPQPEKFSHLAREAGAEDCLDVAGSLSYRQALALMCQLDILVIIGSVHHAYALPGKLFEYIGAGKPILTIAPPGEITDFIRRYGVGLAVEPNDEKGILNAISDLKRNQQKYRIRIRQVAKCFTSKIMAEKTTALFEDLYV